MFNQSLKKLAGTLILAVGFLFPLTAEFNLIPILDFGLLQLGEDSFIFSPAGNLQFKYTKDESDTSNSPDVIAGSLSYGQDIFSHEIAGCEKKNFHKLGLFGKVVYGKNTFLAKLDDRGANPFESYKNFEGLVFYARKLIDSDSMQLDIGGGLAATDTGIVLGGIDIFVVPLPMIRFSYKNYFLNTEMEWIGLPDAFITLFPENMFQIKASCALAGFDLPKDLMFDCALYCFPFRKGFLKEIASISAGLLHEVKKFRITTEDSLKYDYFTVYGQISITALSLRAGYAFSGSQTYRTKNDKITKDYKGGFYASLQAMYKF